MVTLRCMGWFGLGCFSTGLNYCEDLAVKKQNFIAALISKIWDLLCEEKLGWKVSLSPVQGIRMKRLKRKSRRQMETSIKVAAS